MKTIEELQADLEKALTSIEKLDGLNTVLKQENKDAAAKVRAAEEAAENASTATLTELEKTQKRADKAERELAAANERATTSDRSLRDYKAAGAITNALVAANVDTMHVKLLSKALRADVEFGDDGEPTIGGHAIDAYAKSFFAKDGLSYVRAPENSGGGATGSDGGKPTRMTAENWNTTEWTQLAAENPAEAKAVAISAGKNALAATL